MASKKVTAKTVRVHVSEVQYWQESEARRRDADAKAERLLADGKRRPRFNNVLKLLNLYDVSTAVIELVRRAIVGVKPHRGQRRISEKKAAIRFEARHLWKHGKYPSTLAVSKGVYGVGTQRKRVDGWRSEQEYRVQVAAEAARLNERDSAMEEEKKRARDQVRAANRKGLQRAMKRALRDQPLKRS